MFDLTRALNSTVKLSVRDFFGIEIYRMFYNPLLAEEVLVVLSILVTFFHEGFMLPSPMSDNEETGV